MKALSDLAGTDSYWTSSLRHPFRWTDVQQPVNCHEWPNLSVQLL